MQLAWGCRVLRLEGAACLLFGVADSCHVLGPVWIFPGDREQGTKGYPGLQFGGWMGVWWTVGRCSRPSREDRWRRTPVLGGGPAGVLGRQGGRKAE